MAIQTIILTEPADSANEAFTKVNDNFSAITSGGNAAVCITAVDTTAGVLNDKLVAGSGIGFDVLHAGGDEELEISSTGEVAISVTDTSVDYLYAKVIGGTNVTTGINYPSGNERLVISAADPTVKVVSTDSTPGDLFNKITATAGVDLTIEDAYADAKFNVAVPQAAYQNIPIDAFHTLTGSIATVRTYHRGLYCADSLDSQFISNFITSRGLDNGVSDITINVDVMPSGTNAGSVYLEAWLFDQSDDISSTPDIVVSGIVSINGSSFDVYYLTLTCSGVAFDADSTIGLCINADRTVPADTCADPVYITGVNIGYIL